MGGINIVIAIIAVEFFLSLENSAFNAKNLQYANKSSRIIFLTFGSIFSLIFVRMGGPILLFSILMKKNPIHVTNMMIDHSPYYVQFLENHQVYIDIFNGAFLMLLGIQNIECFFKLIKKSLNIAIHIIFVAVLLILFYYLQIKLTTSILLLALILIASFSIDWLASRIIKQKEKEKFLKKNTSIKSQLLLLLTVEYTDMLLSFDSSLTVYSFTNKLNLIVLGIVIGLVISRITTVIFSVKRESNTLHKSKIDRAMVIALFSTGAMLLIEQVVELTPYLITLTAPVLIILYFITLYFLNYFKGKTKN